jgi:hypothetical protein
MTTIQCGSLYKIVLISIVVALLNAGSIAPIDKI